jgi:flavin reductase (DIM6/NTAB) family NADH-FMN oxidoreductase RutF
MRNSVPAHETTLSNYFARQAASNETPKFRFSDGTYGSRLETCTAALSCSLYALYDGGDHWIAVGQVLAVYRPEEKAAPLLLYRGRYYQMASPAPL